ncbi:MAG: deoxyhypusine synthase family protein [Gammaproteobacteria bacterium]|nr:deoxyhypusine synthase family protein [Gammaproteobacteria bacterium]
MKNHNGHFPISEFLETHYRHFNAREVLEAAKGYTRFVATGGKMMVSLAGAMSTAELGKSLAPLIRNGLVSAISSTGANIEEDLFNLVGNSRYVDARQWRYLSMEDDYALQQQGLNRVTDTCIPEDVMLELHEALLLRWQQAEATDQRFFHWEYLYQLIEAGWFESRCEVPLSESWVVAACEMGIPIYTPGAEDSTLGNMFCSDVMQGRLSSHLVMKSGTEQFEHLSRWYHRHQLEHDIGFFQIGGGIAGDFAMCVVPSLIQDHSLDCKHWRYFCHIGDAVTSYGGYSGCPANEKVTWDKLDPDTENYTVNSDASIVAPLIFQYVVEQSGQQQVSSSLGRQEKVSA